MCQALHGRSPYGGSNPIRSSVLAVLVTLVTAVRERAADVVPEACLHEDFEYLGAGGRAKYYRCQVCGAGIIASNGRVWLLRRSASPTRPVG